MIMTRIEMKELVCLLVVLNMLRTCSAKEDWSTCEQISGCNCKWVNGRKQASCENASFRTIPSLSEEIQTLMLDNNIISELGNRIFADQGLINLQKLSLKSNEIKVIEKNAFRQLSIIIEIDLSSNRIHKLDPNTFNGTEKLRMLNLNNNEIAKIEDGLFSNLLYLQVVELNNNRISYIGMKAFTNLPVLSSLKLSGNQLKHVKLSIFENINRLGSLDLKNNPWKCDCHMREFVDWCIKRNLYTHPTTCNEPDYLKESAWNNITLNKFACRPEISMADSKMETYADRLLLSCRVTGDPKPETYWTLNSRTLNNNTLHGLAERKYVNYESDGENDYWYNVTVQKLSRQDYGVYICVAQNAAGMVERNVTISEDQSFFPFTRPNGSDLWVLLLCLLIGLICALILIFMLCFLCCRRVDVVAKKPSNMAVTSNGDIAHHIVMEPEQQKTLLTAVNPVQKPPRKYDSSPQSENGGTELTELNRNLLDDSSVLGVSLAGDSMDDRRSTNSLEQLSCNSQDNLLFQERLRPIPIRAHCPPDLLAFPNRRLQAASPASSCVSTDMDGSRFHALYSPVRSPIYQVHPYESLPYSRTQSPFSPTCLTPVVTQRQGYVTIPRRPRVPSWSSAPTPTIESALPKAEPVYDNLGPRTTADGSSVLSLTRKVAAESPSLRVTSRSLAPSPLYTSHTLPHKSKLNHVYLSIRENEEPQFHPVKQNNGVIKPLPMQFSPANEVSSTADGKRTGWTSKQAQPSLPETSILKKAPSELLSNGTPPTIKAKVPPKPPPKPKKNGPLFEDEGEDGTEV